MSEATAPAAPAPAAPAATSTPATPPSSSEPPAPKPVGKGSDATVVQPPPEPKVQRKEVRANAAKDLLVELTRRREGGDKPEDKPTGEQKQAKEAPKPPPDDKGKPEPKDGPQRAPDGKFAGKPGEAKPEASKAPEAAPQQPARPDNGEHEQKLSRALRELNNKTAEAETHSRTAKELKTKIEQLEAREVTRKKDNNPLDILADYGWDLDSVARAVVEKGVRPRSMRPQLPDEVRAELDSLKEYVERDKRAKAETQAREFRGNSVKALDDYLTKNVDKHPFSAAIKWARDVIVDNTMRAKQADMLGQLLAFEKSMSETSLGLMGEERVFKAMLASKPDLKAKWLAWLGATPSNEATPPASKSDGDSENADGPRSLSSVPTGQAPKPKTRRESKREAVREFDSQWRAARK